MSRHQQKAQPQQSNSNQAQAQQQNQQFVKKGQSTFNYEILLIPISIFLSGLMITSALLFAVTIYMKKAVTKDTLKTTLAEVLKEGGYTAGTGTTTTTPTASITLDESKALITTENAAFGDNSRKVLFVEFSDPSCPYCHAAAGKNIELNAEMGDQFKVASQGGSYIPPVPEMKKMVDEGKASYVWVYTNGHGNGELGAQALYCAKEKGKFWEVHDLLFSNSGYNLMNNEVKNDKANSAKLAEFLKSAVDPSFMTDCLSSEKYLQKIKNDEATAANHGISGTPGYFVNTTNYSGAYSFDQMKTSVDEALNS